MSLNPHYPQGKAKGVLHGIPVLVKDNMATKDTMQTTAGSWALLGSMVCSSPKDLLPGEDYHGVKHTS